MQFRRARFSSFDRTMYHGAASVAVASSMISRAQEKSYHWASEGRSVGLSLRAALLMDLADVGGNVKDGCHIASMGGTWMVFTYGFGGLRDYDGKLSFRPQRPPEAQASLQFPITWRGQILEVEISPDVTTYTLREGDALTIRHGDEDITLTHANSAILRPTINPFVLSGT